MVMTFDGDIDSHITYRTPIKISAEYVIRGNHGSFTSRIEHTSRNIRRDHILSCMNNRDIPRYSIRDYADLHNAGWQLVSKGYSITSMIASPHIAMSRGYDDHRDILRRTEVDIVRESKYTDWDRKVVAILYDKSAVHHHGNERTRPERTIVNIDTIITDPDAMLIVEMGDTINNREKVGHIIW